MAATKRARKSNNRAGKLCIGIILIAFVAVMSVQIIKIYQKDLEYAEQQAELEAQLEAEEARKEELEELEAYMQSEEGKEESARKYGFVYENDIVFKEEE